MENLDGRDTSKDGIGLRRTKGNIGINCSFINNDDQVRQNFQNTIINPKGRKGTNKLRETIIVIHGSPTIHKHFSTNTSGNNPETVMFILQSHIGEIMHNGDQEKLQEENKSQEKGMQIAKNPWHGVQEIRRP